MRSLTIILLITSLFACNQRTDKTNTPIEKFEKFLGEKEVIYLNEIVDDLDNYLAYNYPDHQSKFKAYLIDISEMNVNDYWKIDSTKLKKYKESNLFGKYDTIFPDSVWFNGNTFSIKYPDSGFIEEIIPIKRKNEDFNIDSTIKSLKNEPRVFLIEQSNYYLAFDSIQKSDSLIITYLEAKEALGNLSPTILVGGLLYFLTESNEYFAKRIFVMDIYD